MFRALSLFTPCLDNTSTEEKRLVTGLSKYDRMWRIFKVAQYYRMAQASL